MKNKELKDSFSYILSRKNHFSKFQKNNNFQVHLLLIIVLLLFSPFLVFYSYYISYKVKKLVLRKEIAIVRTENGLKIAKILRDYNNFDVVSLSVRGDNNFSKLELFFAVLSNYNIYSNYIEVLKDPFLRKNLIKVIKVIGFSNLEEKIILNHPLNTLLQFNDHSPESFFIQKKCKEKKIRTVYIQHAPVSDKFPPLYHDLNILFSQDSLNKYKVSNKNIMVKIAFDFRFLEGLKFKNIEKIDKNVLLCPNLLDNISEVEKTAVLLNEHGYNVKIRMHPADRRNLNTNIIKSEVKNIWEDLSTRQIVITNESAIPLEACFLDCLVYKASFWSESIDAYSFISDNFIKEEEKSLDECINSILNKKRQINSQKLGYYIGEVNMNSLKLSL